MTLLLVLSGLSIPAAYLLTWRIRRIALDKQVVDEVNERSSHAAPTPRGGGLSFLLTFLAIGFVEALTAGDWGSPGVGTVALLVAPLAAVGLLDDAKDAPAWVRYLVHLMTAAVAVTMYGPFGLDPRTGAGIGYAATALFSVVSMTAFINFSNFMDGLDGLAASCSMIALLFFALYLDQPVWLPAAAGILGFLPWNLPRASIFMGDAASTCLGSFTAIAFLAAPTPQAAATAFCVTLPLTADAAYTIIRRRLDGENIFQAHKRHIYQRLHQSGLSHGFVTGLYASLTAFACLVIAVFNGYGAVLCILIAGLLIAYAESRLTALGLGFRKRAVKKL